MAQSKDATPRHKDIVTTSALSSKTITSLDYWIVASVFVLQIGFSGGSQFIKYSQGQIEVGGTADWGTGTIQRDV